MINNIIPEDSSSLLYYKYFFLYLYLYSSLQFNFIPSLILAFSLYNILPLTCPSVCGMRLPVCRLCGSVVNILSCAAFYKTHQYTNTKDV